MGLITTYKASIYGQLLRSTGRKIGESQHCAVSSLLFMEKLTVCTVHIVRVGLITTCNRMQRKLALLTPLQSVNFLRDWLPDRKKLRLLRRVLR